MPMKPDWRSVALCALMLFLNNGLMLIGVSAFDPVVLASLHVSVAGLKLGDSLTLLTLAVASPGAGWALDRLGPNRVFAAGALSMAVGMAVFAGGAAHALWLLYVAHVLFGVCLSLCGAFSAALVVTTVSGERPGSAMGALLAANSAGLAFGITLMQGMAGRLGWQGAVLAAAIGALALVPWLYRRLPYRLASVSDDVDASLGAALRSGRFWAIAVVAAASFFVEMGLLTNIVVLAVHDLGFPVMRIGALMTIMFACGIAAHLAAGALTDRMDRRIVHATGIVLMMAGLVALALQAQAGHAGWLALTMAVYGAGWGASYVVLQLLLTTSFPGGNRGRIVGCIGAIEAVGAGLAPVIVGSLRDRTGSYAEPLALLAALLVAVLLGAVLLRPASCKLR
jgi:MFS family permease